MTENSLHDIEESFAIARYTPEERQDYEDSLKVYRDLKNVLDTAELKGLRKGIAQGRQQGRAEGRAEGRAQGRAEGRAEGVASVARSMKAKGMDAAAISELTGMDIDEVRTL